MKRLTIIRLLLIIFSCSVTAFLFLYSDISKPQFDKLWFVAWGIICISLFETMFSAIVGMETHKFKAMKISTTFLYCLGFSWFSMWMCGWYLGF